MICFGVALALTRTRWFQNLELLTDDGRTQVRAWLQSSVPNEQFGLIGVD